MPDARRRRIALPRVGQLELCDFADMVIVRGRSRPFRI
jgi:hypothetical protein